MSAQIVHGGALDEAIKEYGGNREDWLDLSTGINPNAYPVPDLPGSVWQRLPDQGAEEALLQTAREVYRVPDHLSIVAGNGTQSLIELLPRVIPSERVAIMSPTYQEHELSWIKAGRHVDTIKRDDPVPLLSNGLVAVNPNNPDGAVLSRTRLEELSKALALRHGWLIVDEAFCDSEPEASFVPYMGDNVIVLRSFGKFFGLAGVRLGFLIGPAEIVIRVEHLLGPWAVAGPALEIGQKALQDIEWIDATRRSLPQLSSKLIDILAEAGFSIAGQNPLFVLGEHSAAPEIHQELCRQHVLTRRFPDRPNRLRFGLCRDEAELQRLSRTLKDMG